MNASVLARAVVLGIVLGAVHSGAGEPIRLSEPVMQTQTHEVFGAAMPTGEASHTLSDLVADADRYIDQDVIVTTRIAKVCQKKGCFFVATEGATSARVTFKDYGFFIPTDAGGKAVSLAGRFGRKALSQADAQHYAKDLGEAPAKAAEFEYVIVATSVSIPREG